MRSRNIAPVRWRIIALICWMCSINVHISTVHASQVPGIPFAGKIAFIVGQDTTTLSNYKTEVLDADPAFPQPAGITLYTNLVDGVFLAGMGADPYDAQGNLRPGFNLATNDSYDFNAGFFDFSQSLAEYPDAAVSIGLYISDSFANCANKPLRAISAIDNGAVGADITPQLIAQYETAIDVMIQTFKQWNRVVYLRIGYEFDGPWNCYETDFYINAFRYISTRIDELNATKVATVWQAAAWPRDESLGDPGANYIVTAPDHYDVWYPGDEYVDIVGLSTFYGSNYDQYQWSCDELNPAFFSASVAPRVLQDRLLDFARARNKPAMIAEASPQAHETDVLTATCIFSRNAAQVQVIDANILWGQWYEDWFDYIEANNDVIKIAAYINADWDTIPNFSCGFGQSSGAQGCPSGVWGDARIQANPVILQNFKTRLMSQIYDVSDTDGDGIADISDNCINVSNASQVDTDSDGHGNLCDADFDNSCLINGLDLGMFKGAFFTDDADIDMDSSGLVNGVDLGLFKSRFFQPPGPSAPGALCP